MAAVSAKRRWKLFHLTKTSGSKEEKQLRFWP
jgi:hypothetical protein